MGEWKGESIQAVTAKEIAQLQTDNVKSDLEIEPATYYTVNRVIREYRGGFRGIGGLIKNTYRFFKDEALKDQMNSNSFVGGIDGWSFLDGNRVYVVSGWAGVSQVTGNEARLLSLQKSSTHYFQRPDASQVELDSNATSLTGYAGRLVLNKEQGNWILHYTVGAA